MNKEYIIELFDNEQYEEVIKLTDPFLNQNNLDSFNILYFLKSKVVLDNFKINEGNIDFYKKILFFYFYLEGKVDFSNDYTIYIKSNLEIGFNELFKGFIKLNNFHNYFDFGKNEIFLNKIKDITITKKYIEYSDEAKDVDNIVDYLLYFIHECSELYSFSGEHFPLFKWIINELITD